MVVHRAKCVKASFSPGPPPRRSALRASRFILYASQIHSTAKRYAPMQELCYSHASSAAILRSAYNAIMAQEDFDIERLAEYLHMPSAAIAKLADRGKLPARRIGGEWRFSTAEIHHWLENRIGLSDDDALVQMEGALDRASTASDVDQVSIADLLKVEAIEAPLDARTRGSVIGRMTEVAARTHLLWDPEKMAEAVRLREEMHSTALEIGVALLHPRRPMPAILAEAFLALGVTRGGIPFGTGGRLSDIFFLICSTSDHEHLRILARLSRVINDQDFLAAVRASDNAASLHELVRTRESTVRET
jgi:PTS system nitrogen regulatory IIA component